ncbi:MAG: DUF4190 domain-containing protein [Ruminococcus sp.]|nr:DUF4190 domain-containing protein [Ruminococcus sp.]
MDENYNNQNNDYSNNQNPYNPQPQDNNQDTYNQQQGYYQNSYNQPQNGYQNNYNYNQQQGYQNGYNQPQQYYQEPADNSKGFAVASLVLGIVSFFCCGSVCSIVGLILGIMSRKKKPVDNGMATAGIVLSIIALVIWAIALIWSFAVTGSFIGFLQDAANDSNVYYSYSY